MKLNSVFVDTIAIGGEVDCFGNLVVLYISGKSIKGRMQTWELEFLVASPVPSARDNDSQSSGRKKVLTCLGHKLRRPTV
jgi:hypothetical protein